VKDFFGKTLGFLLCRFNPRNGCTCRPIRKGGLGVFVRGVTNKIDRLMTTLALDLFLEMRAVCPGMLALAGVCTWAALMGAGMLLIMASIKETY